MGLTCAKTDYLKFISLYYIINLCIDQHFYLSTSKYETIVNYCYYSKFTTVHERVITQSVTPLGVTSQISPVGIDNWSVLRPCLLTELDKDGIRSRPRLIVFCRGCRHFRFDEYWQHGRGRQTVERSSTQRLPDYFYFDCESFNELITSINSLRVCL